MGKASDISTSGRKLGEAVALCGATILKQFEEPSYEEHTKLVRPYLIAGSGCSNPEPLEEALNFGASPTIGNHHWQNVLATFPEYGVVQCEAENKAWKVPYEVSGNEVETGEPEEVVERFVPADNDETEVDPDANDEPE